jgi:hypothetical protein
MTKGTLSALSGALCLLAFTSAQAFDEDGWIPGTTHMVVDAGLSAGGDKLVTVFYTNGDSQTIYAGDGLFGDFGVQHNLVDTDWSFKATAGFDTWAASGHHADVTFTRYPVDLLALYSIGENHIGFGLTEHLAPRLDLDGLGPNATFDPATGVMVQYQYWLFGARLTSIHYKVSSGCSSGCNIDGSSLSFFFNYVF